MITIKNTHNELYGWKLLLLSDFAKMQREGTLMEELPRLFRENKIVVNYSESVVDRDCAILSDSTMVCRIQLTFPKRGYSHGDRYIAGIHVTRTKDVPSLGTDQTFMRSTHEITD